MCGTPLGATSRRFINCMLTIDWNKTKMKKENLTDIQLHSAGATVRHKSPFENLNSYINENNISQTFREEWVIPFYFELNNHSEEWIQKITQLKPKINKDIILQNLGDFDWRTRSTGAYFASIKEEVQFTDIIGIHLLKSEVCFAGSQYAITLASFNTIEATEYLKKYLDYYLKRTELDFDQTQVMSAVKYLDEINGTDFAKQHSNDWYQFCQYRIQKIEKSINDFKKQNAEGMAQAFEGHLKFWQEDVSSQPIAEAIRVINKIKTAANTVL
jgi:hypothetical protein